MGFVHTQIGLRNPRGAAPREMEVRALVDTASNYLCLPASVVAELGLETNSMRSVRTADGATHHCRYVGPVIVRFEKRECFVGALELGNEVLLGAIPMEDLDLVVNPARHIVTANPESPDAPQSFAMGVRHDSLGYP